MADIVLSRCADLHKIGLRSPEETQRTINFLLSELVKLQARVDELNAVNAELVERVVDLEEALDGVRAGDRDREERLFWIVQMLERLQAGRLH